MTETTFLVFFGCSVIVGLVLTQVAFSRLKSRHEEVWNELGRPNLILNNTPSNNIRWLKFLIRRDYRNVDDRLLQYVMRTIGVLSVIVLLSLLVYFWMVIGNAENNMLGTTE